MRVYPIFIPMSSSFISVLVTLLILYRQDLLLATQWNQFLRLRRQMDGPGFNSNIHWTNSFLLKLLSVVSKEFLGINSPSFSYWPCLKSPCLIIYGSKPFPSFLIWFLNLSLLPSLGYLLGSQRAKGDFYAGHTFTWITILDGREVRLLSIWRVI